MHFLCPGQIHEALASGVTTLIGGGTGPAEGSTATTVTPGEWHIQRMFEALDAFPVNVGLLAKGSTVSEKALLDQVTAGALGFKIHEDWGATPAVIDAALNVCERTGVQLALHADSLNESGFVHNTLAATLHRGKSGEARYRSLHIFHVEGAGGGHAPDMISLVSKPNVLPASTNPTRPLTVNTVKEHVDMMIVCHHLNPEVEADMKFADSRIRPSTMAAEDLLHDMGAISMMSSDAQAMGRIGEMIMRTWQTAHVMKSRYGHLREDDAKADNFRARRYIAKYTINPAVTHGIDHEVGSVETGKLADLVLWEPKFFGVKPHMVIKGGQIAYAQIGDANASIPTPQPYLPRPVWGSHGRSPAANSSTSSPRRRWAVPCRRSDCSNRCGRSAPPAPSPRPTWCTTTACRTSRSTRTASRSPSAAPPLPTSAPPWTGTRSAVITPQNCPWPSGTSCSDPFSSRPDQHPTGEAGPPAFS